MPPIGSEVDNIKNASHNQHNRNLEHSRVVRLLKVILFTQDVLSGILS